ncbi:RE2 [Symbiodinium sp. CCMP2456]|nr:RE2 [Symbiodinium sp. CCMP2456]
MVDPYYTITRKFVEDRRAKAPTDFDQNFLLFGMILRKLPTDFDQNFILFGTIHLKANVQEKGVQAMAKDISVCTDYWRAVEFWLASEGINLPPEVRSSRLMQQMKERAAKIVNHLSVSDVACEDGVAIIRKEMEKSPIIKLLEHKEVDRKRQKFMRLSRYAGESLESFINRASIYRHENDRCQNYKVGSKFYLGHLLDAAKLTRKDEALVKTAAGGLHEEGRVVSALLELSEQLEGQPGWPIGKGEPDLPDDDEFLVQKNKWKHRGDRGDAEDKGGGDRGRHRTKGGRFASDRFRGKFKKRFKQVFHAILEDGSDESSASSDGPSEGDGPPRDDDEDGSGSSTEPSEGLDQQAPAEIFAQEHRAKKRVNELKQMRQYFQKGTNGDRTKAWVKEQQKTEPCFLCQKLGHWSQECPLRKRGGHKQSSSHQVHVTSGPYKSDPGQWELLQSIAEYTVGDVCEGQSAAYPCLVTVASECAMADHEVFWSMRELQSSLILDLGCMKSVAGTRWVNQHIRHLKGLGRWMKATKESESFRFGDGHELKSCFSFTFEATVLGVPVILRLSVVPGDCPPLLSKPACSQLSFVIDTENNTVSSKKLGVVKYGLAETYGGHYAVPIAEFHESMRVVCDPPVPGHLEAVPVYVSEQALSPPEAVEPVLPSSGLRSWTRHDRAVSNTVGPGKAGPPWCVVVRRLVYDTLTGEQLLDEEVDSQTTIRKPWPQKLEKPPSSGTERPSRHRLNTDSEAEEAEEHDSGTPSGWEGVRPEGEASSPRRRPLTLKHARLARRAVARTKSRERVRSKSAEARKTKVNKEEKLKDTALSSVTPGSRSSKSPAPSTPVDPKVSKAILEARAKELEDKLWRHMDPRTIHTPGSKATKMYWVTRVEELEKEWRLCQMTPEEMELDRLSQDGENDSEKGDQEAIDVEALKESSEKAVKKANVRRSSTPAPPRPNSAPSTSTTGPRGRGAPKVKALTDHAAPFPSLSNKFSDDVVINLALSLQGQLFAFKWKMFTWMLRVRRAVRLECGPKSRWKRNPRWLMLLFGKQVASMWGHLGLTQKLRRGAGQGQKALGILTLVAAWQSKWSVLEVFPTGLEAQGTRAGGWAHQGPLWTDDKPPTWRQCRQLRDKAVEAKPDVLVLCPPAGPWSPWSSASSMTQAQLRQQKVKYWPMWYLIGELWAEQCANHRLVILVVPSKMRPPDPDELRRLHSDHYAGGGRGLDPGLYEGDQLRDPKFETKVDMCEWGTLDPESQRPFKKSCRVEVNDPWWCAQLSAGGVCRHAPGAHQEVCGHTYDANGRRVARMEIAQVWPPRWFQHLCETAQATLEARTAPTMTLALHQECSKEVEWETVPVEVEQSPEGQLRQNLGEATGYQYDYIYFEGASASLTKPLRNTLAKLHVALGHISQEKLKRMLHLQGAKDHIIAAVGDLRCQVCQAVTAPRAPPKAAYGKPQRFNQRVLADVFFIWDSQKTKYAVIHAVDAFSLYQVASLMPTAKSNLVAHFMKNYWIGVFGPPEIFMSDGGSEFAAETESLMRAYDVFHEVVPPTAKWRMGLAERHGAVLKLLTMKTIQAVTAQGYSEVKACVVSAAAARNRQARVSGFSPTQIVLGKDVAIPSSLLDQLEKGHFRYVLNQDLAFDEARKRNEQIRHAAEQAFIWMDANETLRKAINAKTRHPRMEFLYEGANVYFYEPPASRRGLPRRLQDQVSWMGPGVVAALERRDGAIRRVWVRYRNKLKGLPLEYIRLAAAEEVESSKVCQKALHELEKELEGGRPEIEEMSDNPDREEILEPMEFSDDSTEEAAAPPEDQRYSHLDDVPLQFRKDKRESVAAAPGPMKRVRFEDAKKDAQEHLDKVKALDVKYEPGARSKETPEGAASQSSRDPAPPPPPASHRGHGVLHMQRVWHLDGATRSQRKMMLAAKRQGWAAYALDIDELTENLTTKIAEASKEPPQTTVEEPVTGKPRQEFKWNGLDGDWRKAFLAPLKKAIDVYADNDAIEPVPLGKPVPPEKILPSRFVLTNKSDDPELEKANLRARWVLAGHLDKEAGQYATEAPTASLVGHNLVCFVSAQMGWKMKYADISSAFLQGEKLDDERVVYIKMPRGYPEEVCDHLRHRLGERMPGSIRTDVVRLTKGGFGLAESPRLWYLRLKRGLVSLGLKELKLSPGTFVLHLKGKLRGILSIHVDDLRMAFDRIAEAILEKLRTVFHFGEWKDATTETVKFCGRWERQCPDTFKVTITMDGYAPKLKDAPERDSKDRAPLTDAEKKWVASVGGQLNWMARQGRADLAYGISRVQQMAGARDPDTIKMLNQLVKKAREPYELVYQRLPGTVEDMVFLAVSDASHGSMPKGRSQGGMMILVANKEILEGESLVNCLLYHSAVLKRVVRSSLAAEISQAAETLDQCEYVRAMMAEVWDPQFTLQLWRWSAARWPEVLVLDSKTGYDVLNSISNGEDKRLAIDVAMIKEAIFEEDSNRWVRWVPGLTIPADGLTKEYGNPVRDKVMKGGPWSLKDCEEAQRLREEAGFRKRKCKDRARAKEKAFEETRLKVQSPPNLSDGLASTVERNGSPGTMASLCWAVVLLASNVPARGEEEPRGPLKIETFSWKGGDRVERIVRTIREDDDEEGNFNTFHHNKTAGARGIQARLDRPISIHRAAHQRTRGLVCAARSICAFVTSKNLFQEPSRG